MAVVIAPARSAADRDAAAAPIRGFDLSFRGSGANLVQPAPDPE